MLQQIVVFGAVAGVLIFVIISKVLKGRRIKHMLANAQIVDSETQAPAGKAEVQEAPVLARVYDAMLKPTGIKKIPGDIVALIKKANGGTLGRQWNFYGQQAYALRKEKDNYSPMENYLTQSREHPPALVFEAAHQPEIGVSRDMSTTDKSFMEQYGQILPWLIAIAFIMFLVVKG